SPQSFHQGRLGHPVDVDHGQPMGVKRAAGSDPNPARHYEPTDHGVLRPVAILMLDHPPPQGHGPPDQTALARRLDPRDTVQRQALRLERVDATAAMWLAPLATAWRPVGPAPPVPRFDGGPKVRSLPPLAHHQ